MPDSIVFVGDVHLSDQQPPSRIDDYSATLWRKLDAIAGIARDRSARAVVFLGDLFESKSPQKTRYATTNRFVEHLRSLDNLGIPSYTIVGNHDVRFGNIDLLPEQPLGTVLASGVLTRLGQPVEFLPAVEVAGIDFMRDPRAELPERAAALAWKSDTFRVLCLHNLIFPEHPPWPGGEGYLSDADLLDVQADLIVAGDWHGTGYRVIAPGKTVVQPGSVMRGPNDRDHPPSVFVIELGGMELVQIPHEPAEKVFLAEQEAVAEVSTSVTDYIAALRGAVTTATELSPVSLVGQVKAACVEPPEGVTEAEVRETAIQYLEGKE